MGHKLAVITADQIEAIADSLKQSCDKMTVILAGMSMRNRSEVLIPWNERQFTALDVITASTTLCEAQARQDFNAIDQKRTSHGEKVVAKRVERQTKSATDSPARGPGRPRKNKID